MKVLMYKYPNHRAKQTLKNLNPFEKVYVASRMAWEKRDSYKNKQLELEKEEHNRIKRMKENLKATILHKVNSAYDTRDDVKAVTICVDSNFGNVIDDIVKSEDFAGYNVKILPRDEDYARLNPKTPYLIKFERIKLA